MKKPGISLIAVLLFVVHVTSAQQIGYKELTDKRIEYIAQRLELTSQEAEKFWPLFREFHAEREKLAKAGRTDDRKLISQLSSEKDYENAINQMLESKMQQTLLMKKYNELYLKIMPPSKVYKLYIIDEEFNKRLLNQLKEQGRPNPK